MPLPDRPSLEFLRKLAKDRLAEMRRADPSARLAQAQLAVAREQGFTSWRALRAELDRRLAAAEPDAVVQLFAAIRRGDGTAVNRLLADHPTLANARDEEGSTPLSAAVDAHRAALIPLLLRRGGDPHLVYAHSAHTPLSWAVVIEAYDCARALMEAGVEPDLFCAAGLGEVERVRAFFTPEGRLRPRASITGSSRYAADGTRLPCPPPTDREVVSDALYMACRAGHEGTARELLTHGPDLGFRAFAGGTALHWAYFAGAPRGGGAPAGRGGGPHAPRSRARLHAGGVRHLLPGQRGLGRESAAAAGRGPAPGGGAERARRATARGGARGRPGGGEGPAGGGGRSGAAQRGGRYRARAGPGAPGSARVRDGGGVAGGQCT